MHLVILVLLFLLLPLRVIAREKGDSGWVLKKNHSGIQVFTRGNKETGFLEFKGVTELPGTTLSNLLALFDDTSSYPRWMYECTEAKVLKMISFHERYTYTVIRGSWPIADRDLVGHSVMHQDPATHVITILLDGQPCYFEACKGRVRIPAMRGTWTFTPLVSGGARIVYQMYMEPGGSIPRGLVNTFVDSVPYETLVKFREVAKEARYANARYSQIVEPEVAAAQMTFSGASSHK